jgi:hypothetical protein
MKKSVAAIAAEYLREKEFPAVMSGDSYLLHEIAERAGMGHDGWRTEKRVLDAIDRTNKGELEKVLLRAHRILRSFWLPGKFKSK